EPHSPIRSVVVEAHVQQHVAGHDRVVVEEATGTYRFLVHGGFSDGIVVDAKGSHIWNAADCRSGRFPSWSPLTRRGVPWAFCSEWGKCLSREASPKPIWLGR